jgi:hypothetical protein
MKKAVFWDVTQCGTVKTDVSGERVFYNIRVDTISELRKMLAVTSN